MASRLVRVLDTSALLALRGDEAGADRVERLLADAKAGRSTLLASFMTRMELLYVVWRDEGEASARDAVRLVESFPLEWVSCEPAILDRAARIKAAGGLSVSDAWIAATALERDATLVHCDPELEKVAELKQERIA